MLDTLIMLHTAAIIDTAALIIQADVGGLRDSEGILCLNSRGLARRKPLEGDPKR